MKTLITKLSIFALLFITLASCSKDSDNTPRPQGLDNIVGTWDMVRADATAYVDGYRIDDIVVVTDGSMSFQEDGTGHADFSMSFEGESDQVKGDFTWERDGFELVISVNEEPGLRYAIITDETNYQELQVTYEEEDSNDEVEFTFIMERIR